MKKPLYPLWVMSFYLMGFLLVCLLQAKEPSGKSAPAVRWSDPKEIVLPSPDGPIKGITQTCGHAKMVFIPTTGLLWTGFSMCETFLVVKDKIVGIQREQSFWIHTSSVKLQASKITSPILSKELDVFLEKMASEPGFYMGDRINLKPIVGGWLFGSKIPKDENIFYDLSAPKITNISFEKSHVIIELKKKYGDKAVVIFNEAMEPLRAMVGDKEVFVKGSKSPYDRPPVAPETALSEALTEGDAKKAQELLAKGVNLEATDQNGYTVLMTAIEQGRTEIALALIAKGADVNAKNKEDAGCAPLMYAAQGENIELAGLLLDKGADLKAKDDNGKNALLWAIKCGSKEMVELLLSKGMDVNEKAPWGATPLHEAVGLGRAEIVSVLLDKGAKINAKDKEGKTPLMHAAEYNRLEAAKVLLDHGASLNLQDNLKMKALTYAQEGKHQEMVKLFEQAAASKK